MNSKRVSIDLAKNVFQVCTYSKTGKIFTNKKISRNQLSRVIQQIEPTIIAMETCYSANYWGRRFKAMGHEINLIPAQHVKPFVRGNKNDSNDAIAIAEASLRPNMRFVPVKSLQQQDIQIQHRIRQRHVSERTALVNQMRGILAEYGVIISKGWRKLQQQLPDILEDGENELTPIGRESIAKLSEELSIHCKWIDEDNLHLKQIMKENEDYHRLLEAPGFGPIVASATIAAIGNGAQFKSARQMAAWLGLTPRGEASGERSTMKGISKRGNRYLRTLFIHGARAIVTWCEKKDDPLSLWIQQLIARRGKHKAIVAVAHKMARYAWVILNRKERYKEAETNTIQNC